MWLFVETSRPDFPRPRHLAPLRRDSLANHQPPRRADALLFGETEKVAQAAKPHPSTHLFEVEPFLRRSRCLV